MLPAFLSTTEPVPVIEDEALRETTTAWRAAQAEFERLQERYRRLKRLITPPANKTLSDLGTSVEEQDQAIIDFPGVVEEFGTAKAAEETTRLAYERAYAKAYAARKAWFAEQLREKERDLIDVIEGAVYDRVKEIHALLEAAEREEISIKLEPSLFPDVPLRIGGSRQGGLELVLGELRALIAKS